MQAGQREEKEREKKFQNDPRAYDDQNKSSNILEPSNEKNFPTSSDAYCFGNDRNSRTCRFRNLCYDHKIRQFFLLNNQNSLLINLPLDFQKELLDLTAVSDHNLFYWGFQMVDGENFFKSKQNDLCIQSFKGNECKNSTSVLTIIKEPAILSKRFYPLNIMHILHDDWLGLYNLSQIWPSISLEKFVRLIFYDVYPPNATYDPPYGWLTGGTFEKLEDIIGDNPAAYVCFSDVVVGNSKANTWYQYGYKTPQGPLPKQASGWEIREAAKHILRRLGLPPHWQDTREIQTKFMRHALSQQGSIPEWITRSDLAVGIFSRRTNRLILNEDDLLRRFQERFGLPVRFLRMEDHSLSELIALLQKTPIAIGMHGCLFTLAIFMPPGSILLEAFPYGVPSENYTPYKTLAGLPGMRLIYRAWENRHPEATIGHPDRLKRHGGLGHLSPEERQRVLQTATVPSHLCCENPYWLYRIYQDTWLDLNEIEELLIDALKQIHQSDITK